MRLVFSMIRPDGSASRDYTVEGETLQIGRDEDADIVLDAANVSSKHAEICLMNGTFLLRDLHSTNGTLLNGRRINETATLASGSILQFGQTGPQMKIISLQHSSSTAGQPSLTGSTKRYAIPLAIFAIAGVVIAGLVVSAMRSNNPPSMSEAVAQPAAVPASTGSNVPEAPGSPEPALEVAPPTSRFAWIGIQDSSEIVLVCSGVLLGEKHCLTCGFVSKYSAAALSSQGLSGSRLVVGVPDEKSDTQWQIIDVLDNIKAVPAEAPEMVLLSLKENARTPLADRYQAADSKIWGKEFATIGDGAKKLTCWGFAISKDAVTLSPVSTPKVCRAETTAQSFGTSRFQVQGKPSLNLIRVANDSNACPGMIVFSQEGRLLGMLTRDALVPVDRLLSAFPEEARGLIQ